MGKRPLALGKKDSKRDIRRSHWDAHRSGPLLASLDLDPGVSALTVRGVWEGTRAQCDQVGGKGRTHGLSTKKNGHSLGVEQGI